MDKITPWITCPDCEDSYCTIHQDHVADCDCPGIDWWSENGLYPYSEIEIETLKTKGLLQ